MAKLEALRKLEQKRELIEKINALRDLIGEYGVEIAKHKQVCVCVFLNAFLLGHVTTKAGVCCLGHPNPF